MARGNDPYHNLAVEKHLMDTLPEDMAILYLWQNQHTIMIGRNQNPWQECKVEEFLRSGGQIARRMSGGGSVYHDLGNLNFTLILPKSDFDVFRQLSVISQAAGMFGIRAELSGRNDLQAAGRKFCENAFYKAGYGAYHHGTILWNTNMDCMTHYLTAEGRKPQNQGVIGAPARMANLKTLSGGMTIPGLREALCRAFSHVYEYEPTVIDEYMLDAPSLSRLTAEFSSNEWLYPEALKYSFTAAERFPWGGVTVKLLHEDGVIRKTKIFTDAMEASLFLRIEHALIGSPFLISAIGSRFEQRLDLLTDPALLQMAQDVCALICGKMRAMDRANDHGEEA
jgi:lipoate-protein ligase A